MSENPLIPFMNQNALANQYYNYEKLVSMAEFLQSKTTIKPIVGIICGSGLGNIATLVENQTILHYTEIPDFPVSTVQGHKGNLLFGTLSGVPVVCMQGRFHPYEGYCPALCAMPVRIFKLLGVKLMMITNASGGLNRSYQVGDIVLIKDHLSYPLLTLNHPLVGPNDERFGPRFLPINRLYDKDMRDLFKKVSSEQSLSIQEGVYGNVGGPTFETISNNRLYVANGADIIGMSTAHEATVAKHCGMKIVSFSLVTDMVPLEFDVNEESNHEEILEVAKQKEKVIEGLVQEFLKKIAEDESLLN